MRNAKWILITGVIIILLSMTGCTAFESPYVTDSVNDYGVIGSPFFNRNKKMEEVFSVLFPQKLEDDFHDIQYHYKAVNRSNEWTAEMYLEFTLDEKRFDSYVETIADPASFQRFPYATDWHVYTVNDYYRRSIEADGSMRLTMADIEQVLICPNECRVVYIALCSPDTWIPVDTLRLYFDRFGIDPQTYGITEEDYETYQFKDYGRITGTTEGRSAQLQHVFARFFPADPDPKTVVRYHFKALDCVYSRDIGGITLELQLTDEAQLYEAAEQIAPISSFQLVDVGARCMEYRLSDELQRNNSNEIISADLERVLLLPAKNRIIYTALIVMGDHPVQEQELYRFLFDQQRYWDLSVREQKVRSLR